MPPRAEAALSYGGGHASNEKHARFRPVRAALRRDGRALTPEEHVVLMGRARPSHRRNPGVSTEGGALFA
jgi:hypothetical protein